MIFDVWPYFRVDKLWQDCCTAPANGLTLRSTGSLDASQGLSEAWQCRLCAKQFLRTGMEGASTFVLPLEDA